MAHVRAKQIAKLQARVEYLEEYVEGLGIISDTCVEPALGRICKGCRCEKIHLAAHKAGMEGLREAGWESVSLDELLK